MHPVIAVVAGLTVPTHGFFVALGVAAALGIVAVEARRRGMWCDELLVAVAGGLVGGALGMRATSWLRSPDLILHSAGTQVGQIWQYGAKSVLGGLTGAYLGVLVAKRLVGYRVRTGDVFAPAVALGMALGRFGCLLTEPPGRVTSLPWGIHLTAAQVTAIPGCSGGCASGLPLHPSFAYEIVFQAIAFGWLLWLRGRVAVPGALLTLYLAAYATFRFLVEFTRDNEVVVAGLTRGQLFILSVSPLLVWRVTVLLRGGLRTPPASHQLPTPLPQRKVTT